MSQTAKHTPGPWSYEKATKTIRAKPSNYWIATMDSWDGAVNHEANAQLIAAAPDLLEALRGLLSHFEGSDCLAAASGLNGNCYRHEVEAAFEAIQKAGGEQ